MKAIKYRKSINWEIGGFMAYQKMCSVWHRDVISFDTSLLLGDGVHLLNRGQRIFTDIKLSVFGNRNPVCDFYRWVCSKLHPPIILKHDQKYHFTVT